MVNNFKHKKVTFNKEVKVYYNAKDITKLK